MLRIPLGVFVVGEELFDFFFVGLDPGEEFREKKK
jgi:hypothetical protein